MPYLNLDLDYFDHPKTVRLVGLLGKESEILPIRLWIYCGKYHSADGKLSGYSPQEVESAVKWWGRPCQMVEAMVKVGFLVNGEDGYQIKDWVDHEGHFVVLRERAKAGAKARWDKIRCSSNANKDLSNAQAMPHTIPSIPSIPKTTNNNHHPPPSLFSKKIEKPYIMPTEHLGKAVMAWKMVTGNQQDDRAWDKLNWGRISKTAGKLLEFFGGDLIMTIDCMEDTFKAMSAKGLTCTIETVAKHADTWKLKEVKNRGTVEIRPA